MILSIIVPVYNVEKYLAKCIDSLLQQDLAPESYEIILVNDGSTDGSENIAKQYEATYKHIKLIIQPNGGLSAARNTGLLHAKGKYVQFVDSDDYLEPNVLAALVAKMESEDLDILRFNYQNVNEAYQVFAPYKIKKNIVDYSDAVCDGFTFLTERLGYACYAWQFVIKTALFQNKELFFKEGIYFEDTEWTPRLLVRAQRITSIDLIVYNYLMRTGSITQSVELNKKRKVLDDLLVSISTVNRVRDLHPQLVTWSQRFTARIHINYLKYLSHHLFREREVFVNKLKDLHCLPIQSDHENKYFLFLVNLSPLLFVYFLKFKSLIK